MTAKIRSGDGWSYTLTSEDKLWAARMVEFEGGESPDGVLWSMTQRMALPNIRRRYGTFTDLIRAYSQPINPKWMRDGEFCRPGGQYHNQDNCSERWLSRRDRSNIIPWTEIDPAARAVTERWYRGALANPVPRAVEFAAPSVSEGFLSRNPGSSVVLRAGNWFIKTAQTSDWPDGWVRMEPATSRTLLAALVGVGIGVGTAVAAFWPRRGA